jgi:hypothetical protein
MDKAILVEQDIDGGRKLVQALDSAGFPVVAALWNYLPEDDSWRLLIASPKVNELGPRGAYEAIQDVLRKSAAGIPLHCIVAVHADDPLVTELRIFAGTDPAPFLGSTYLQATSFGDTYIEKAYVYRAERIVGKTGLIETWAAMPGRSRQVWTAYPCKITFEEGFFRKIEVEGLQWVQTRGKNGVSANLWVPTETEVRGGVVFGDVMRWSIVDGRLRGIETVARDVRIEGFAKTTPSAPTVSSPATQSG